MNNKFYFIFLLFGLNIVCFQTQATENDFDKVCSYFQALEKNSQVTTMTHLQRNDFILNKINKNLQPSSNARVAWESVGSAEGSQRYDLYKSSAESVLKGKWQCEAMAKLADKTGEF